MLRKATILSLIVQILLVNFVCAQSLPDNMVPSDCSTDVEAMTWGVQNSWSSGTVVSNLNIPLVGDLDGDGHPEILCFSLNGQTSNTEHWGQGNLDNQMLVYDGVTKQLKATITMESPVSAYDAASYGLVRTSTGKGLIVTANYDYKLRAYDITSSTPSTPYWVSDVDYGLNPEEFAVNVSFTDFNGDGHPEVYVRNKIYNAENGKLLAVAATTNTGSSFAHWTHESHRKLSSPIVADMSGDGHPELILGNVIYEVSISNTNGTSGNSLTLYSQVTPPSPVPADGHTQVADFNLDGHLDVFISIRDTDIHYGTVYCYVWDVYNNTVSVPLIISNSHSGKSIPLIADIDNDGLVEVVIQNGSTDTYNRIQAYKYNTITESFSMIWGMNPNEDSFSNSFTAFDFNQDGLLELVICDQGTLRIVNGSGKSHLTLNDTIPVYVLSSFPFTETTIMQYPVIADVDADGAAEIVSVGSTKLNIFKSSGQPWAPARPVWNQYVYNVTNINKDLTVPSMLFDNATAFTDPDGVVRRPFNNFLQQATTLDQYGRPFMALANATAVMGDITYENDVYTLTYQICNTGGQTLFPPVHCSFYADEYGGAYLGGSPYNSPIEPGECVSCTKTFTEEYLSQHSAYPNLDSIILVINENQHGIAQNGGLQMECDTTDNTIWFYVDPCQVPVDTVRAEVCVHETYSDENFDITAEQTAVSGVYYFQRVFQVGSCDSMVVLQLRVHPAYDLHFTETIPEGTAYDRHGIFLHESLLESGERIDTSITYQSVYGCDSVIHITVQVAAADITLYLPNAITPSKSDGLNDVFSLPEKIRNQMADFEIMIYNRWGEMVYYSTDKSFCWNGECKGKTFYNNVYQYVIHYSTPFGKKFTVKGTVTVL